MPAIFTHVQFGKEVASSLPAHLQKLVNDHPESFYLGTQGPDLLFYHKPLKAKKKNPARKQGWDMHKQSPEGFFLQAGELLLDDPANYENREFTPTTAEAAYVLGFLCHFTLDRQCHPYINEQTKDGLTHTKIESELDKSQLRKIGEPIRGFNTATLFFPCEESRAASAKILGVSEKETEVALKTMRKLNGLFSSKNGFTHAFFHTCLTLVGLNKSIGGMFLHKKDEPRSAEIMPVIASKFNESIPLAQSVICDYFATLPKKVAAGSLENEFFHSNYGGV